ncbi:MAG: inositol monophosphatase family protein [Bradymonadaceae bacterium]
MTDYLTELRCAEALAREAGKQIIVGSRQGFQVDLKAKNDLVTNVDRSIERFLTAEFGKLFPEDTIFGEEYGSSDEDEEISRRVWLIDPIDGTTNFAMGIPLCCVSIALQVDGHSVLGVIYEPWRDELFSALRGGGATLDGLSIQVSGQPNVADSVLVTGFPAQRTDDFERTLEQFAAAMQQSRGVRRLGSAAIDLAYVAAGRLDGFWEYGLSPWDTAAGYLLVEEAGGQVTNLDNQAFSVQGESILATNGGIHESMYRLLKEAIS